MAPSPPTPTFRYVVALLAVAAATLLQLATWPLLHLTPYQLFYLVVGIIAWQYGAGPALLAIALSLVTVDYLFIPPFHELNLGAGAVAPVITAAAAAVLIARGGASWRRNRDRGESQRAQLELIARAGAVLAESLEFERTLVSLARLCVGRLADWCIVDVVNEDGEPARVATAHADPSKEAVAARLCEFPPDPSRREGVPRVMRTRRPQVINDVTDEWLHDVARSEEHLAIARQLGIACAMYVPLIAHNQIVGALSLFRSHPVPYDRNDEDLASELARRAALAIESTRLYESARRARDEAESSRHSLELIAESGPVFAAELDLQATIASITRMLVPALADTCVVDIPDEHALSITAITAECEELLLKAREKGHDGVLGALRHEVMESGRPSMLPAVGESFLQRAARDSEHGEILRRIGHRSLMYLPLRARGRTFGVIELGITSSGRTFGAADLALAGDLASRAALAIDNALLYQEAQAANRAKDEFLATVSHEIRTPLNAILGWAQILRDGGIDEETAAHALEAIERNARVQTTIIEDLLDISRIIAGRLSLELAPVSLEAIIVAAIDAVRPTAESESVDIRIEGPATLPSITGDASRLQQVFWNLLTNAVRYSPEGSEVTVSASVRRGWVEIAVTDSGPGITPELLPYLFDRFKQGESSPGGRPGSLGLGLSIVRAIVQQHGGSVEAESRGPGSGATFTVRLPLPAREAVGDRLEPAAGPAPESTTNGESQALAEGILRGVRVLAVDDEPDARELVRAVLERYGATVLCAGGVSEAIAIAIEWRPHLVVSDIGIPDQDGYSLIDRLRKLASSDGLQIPAIALTAFARPEDRERVLAAGFRLHLSKPFEPDDLVRAATEIVGRSLAAR